MPYIPHTEADRTAMLDVIGASRVEELFREIPENLRVLPGALRLPPALDEHRLFAHLAELSRRNVHLSDVTCFLGAGIYDRFIPASVDAVISRGEFLTAYTPYQPEASQGYLQTIYEFQTMVADLFGCDIANASMYDGGTALAEAAIMASGIKGRDKVVVSEAIHPHFREILETYTWAMGIEVVTLDCPNGSTSFEDASKDGALKDSACLIVGYPNFFGTLEDLAAAKRAASEAGALLVVYADPVACALVKPPGHYGADIVVGEGQSMGVAMGLGGPLVGLFACKQEFVRQIPGRIVGRTREVHGDRDGYVMTLRTREQDIRREKATSNICTNEALMALAATVYMTALGKNGMQSVAESSVRNTQYAIHELQKAGFSVQEAKVFDEFVLHLPIDAKLVRDRMLKHKILAGLPLGAYYEHRRNEMLVAVTEARSKNEIDTYVRVLLEVTRS